jgi:hypothetical protein
VHPHLSGRLLELPARVLLFPKNTLGLLMAYSEADLDEVVAKVKEARERVQTLTIEIELARHGGKPSQVAEETLVTMLTTLSHMVDLEKEVRTALTSRGS